MIDNSFAPSAYNRFIHLDELEDRIIYYLISPNKKTQAELEQTHIIWKLLYYNDCDALNKELPTYQQIVSLISNGDGSQTDKRIFRSPHFEDAWTAENTILKVYIDRIIPVDRYKSVVNVGIDIITHNKCVDINASDEENSYPVDNVNGVDVRITMKSRITTLVKAVLFLLNGAQVQGIGTIEFTQTMSRFQYGQYGVWNNRNFEGIKLTMGCLMSGVS